VVLPWHLEVTGAHFPAVVSDGRLSGLLETAVAADIAGLLGLASPDWVTIELLSSIAATRRATTPALAVDVMVQVPEAERDAAAATMLLKGASDVLDSWLTESLIVYNSFTAAATSAAPSAGRGNVEVNQADSAANAVGTASGAEQQCGLTCIIIICLTVVIVVGIVSASVVRCLEAKKKRQRMKDAVADAEMYVVDDYDDDAAAHDAYMDAMEALEAGELEDVDEDDGASFDAYMEAMEALEADAEVEDVDEEDECFALAPAPELRRGSKRLSRAFSQSPSSHSSRRPSGAVHPNAMLRNGSVRWPAGVGPMPPGVRQRLSTSARCSVGSLGGHVSHGDVTMDDAA
jgi:hypothetical protein